MFKTCFLCNKKVYKGTGKYTDFEKYSNKKRLVHIKCWCLKKRKELEECEEK